MTASRYVDTILGNCQPLAPLAADVEPKLSPLAGIRAVLFDIYGTLLISASGDIGASSGDHRIEAIAQTAELLGLRFNRSDAAVIHDFESEIARTHSNAKEQGVEYPEVDIVEIWRRALSQALDGDFGKRDSETLDVPRFALEYEVRVNPVWPMPGAEAILGQLAANQLVLGIVSNAQFFTPLLFPAFFGKSTKQFGFASELSYFSYEHRQSKPGSFLYRMAQQQLQLQGIQPAEVLHVGNDMLNDVAAAQSVGFRTALFAGDQRSLRMRTLDERVHGVVPDVIITELTQLTVCLAT